MIGVLLAAVLGVEPEHRCEDQGPEFRGIRLVIAVDNSESMDRRVISELRLALARLYDARCVDKVDVFAFRSDDSISGVSCQSGQSSIFDTLSTEPPGTLKPLPKPGRDTPLGEAVDEAVRRAEVLTDDGRTTLVFVLSDGEPDCGCGNCRADGNCQSSGKRPNVSTETLPDSRPQATAVKRALAAMDRARHLPSGVFIEYLRLDGRSGPSPCTVFTSPYATAVVAHTRVEQVVERIATRANKLCECRRSACENWLRGGSLSPLKPECACEHHLDCQGDDATAQFVCLPGEGSPCPLACTDPFPDAVLVGNERGFRCSGVVVGRSKVLTAAHCLPATRVGLGERMETAQVVAVSRAIRAPGAIDLALLDTVVPVLPPGREPPSIETSDPTGPLVHVGFGANGGEFGIKRVTTLSSSGWGCGGKASRETGCQPDYEMFVPGAPGHDTCAGDSGGPLFWVDDSATACRAVDAGVRRRSRLVAITSRSGDGAKVTCGQGGIATRLARVREWLDSNGVSTTRSAR